MLNAAIVEFARSGYAGTSTEAIAARAGISQPYLFRLFGTKKDLFIATYNTVASRIEEAFAAITREFEGEEAMVAMGMAYLELLQDPDLLQVQLHGFVAAAADPDIAVGVPGHLPAPVAFGRCRHPRRTRGHARVLCPGHALQRLGGD